MKYPVVAERAKRHRIKVIGIVLGTFIVCGLGATLLVYNQHTVKEPAPEKRATTPVNKQAASVATPTTNVSGRYLFNGTIFWARGVEWRAKRSGMNEYAWPFSGLSTFDRGAYDAWIADLECPVTDTNIPYQTQVDRLVFNCRPEYLPEAAKYFTILDLANNHSDNAGFAGLQETRKRLSDAGIQHYGSYDASTLDDVCEVIALPVRIVTDGVTNKGTLPVAFCAWHYFYRTPLPGELEAMDRYARIMPVFAFAHMGAEYNTTAQPIQVDIAHRIADRGPEFVIANNPHWVQNSEVYNGKLIVYSTGNFIFDQLDSEGTRSASIDATMSVKYDANIAKWLKLGQECVQFHDDCIGKAEAQGLTKPKVSFGYAVVAGDNSSHLTKKGDSALQKSIEERMNWSAVIALLNPSN